MVAVLDAWAVLALLQAEPAGPRVRDAVADGGAVVSWISLGEVHYVMTRERSAADADSGLRQILPSVRAEAPDPEIIIAAARIKAGGGLSYADCFVIATAQRYGAPLLTGDPEIIDWAGDVEVIDLRTAG